MLKNRRTDEPLFVVVFTLLPKDGGLNEGETKTSTEVDEPAPSGDDELD